MGKSDEQGMTHPAPEPRERELLRALVDYILDSSAPIGPMRSRADYPPQLQAAITALSAQANAAAPNNAGPSGEGCESGTVKSDGSRAGKDESRHETAPSPDGLVPAPLDRLEDEEMRKALSRAAYALFQIKRMAPERIVQFASDEHRAACSVLDGILAHGAGEKEKT